MQIVINVDDDYYFEIKNAKVQGDTLLTLEQAVVDGTPLLKGHGRLIDADKLLDSDGIIADSRKCHYIPMIDVYQAPTIIEADKAESEE